jgi:hypothetical protein
MQRIAVLLCLLALPITAVAQEGEAEEASQCTRWTFKQLELGMSVASVKQIYPSISKIKTDPAFGLGGTSYGWRQQESGRSTDFRVIAASDADDARVILINARIKSSGVSPTELQQALLEKWGGIAETERDVAPGQDAFTGRSVEEVCDVRAQFSGRGNTQELNAEITLFSIEAQRRWQQQQLEDAGAGEARELLE